MNDIKRLTKPENGVFLVGRTSCYRIDYDNPPCDEAYLVEVMTVDIRSVDDPKKIAYYGNDDAWWYEKGENHRVENGRIVRDMGFKNRWAVDIADVVLFVEKYGDCVLSIGRNGIPEIEIYDDYRE